MAELSFPMAALAGTLLGVIFYGGLWWTVRRSMASAAVSLWLIGSFALRASIAGGGFYVVSHGDWRSWVACLIGFVTARAGVTWLTRVPPASAHRLIDRSRL